MRMIVAMFVGMTFAVLALRAGDAQAAGAATAPAATRSANVVRVAALGGINDFGFWQEVASRFEKESGVRVETVVSGNKDGVADQFKRGGIDLIAMQSSDAVIGLVADGYATDARPWLKSDLVIVGPEQDPAGIKGMADASAAIRKIVASKSAFVVHGNSGADGIVRGILQADKSAPDAGQIIVLLDDHQRRVLQAAAEKKAYTLIARTPFKSGKITAAGMSVMVEGDPLLHRPFVAAIADGKKVAGTRTMEARRFLDFLTSDATQKWIAEFGKGKVDDRPLFFAIADGEHRDGSKEIPGQLLAVNGEAAEPLALDRAPYLDDFFVRLLESRDGPDAET
jgi:tungstate transport system substrate-binding protein